MHQQHHPIRRNDIRRLCTHTIHRNPSAEAHLCGSPALRGQSVCYHHQPSRLSLPTREQLRAQARARRAARLNFSVPTPTNLQEVLGSLQYVMRHIAAGDIDLRLAGRLLYALDAAGRNLDYSAAPPIRNTAPSAATTSTSDSRLLQCMRHPNRSGPNPAAEAVPRTQ